MRLRARVVLAAVLPLGCLPRAIPAGAPAGITAGGGWRVVGQLGDAGSTVEGGVTAATFSANGQRAAFGGRAGVDVVEFPSRRRVRFFSGARLNDHDLALSPDGTLLAAGGGDNRVRLWDVASGAERAVLEHAAKSTALVFSSKGDLLAVGGDNLSVAVWDLGKRRWVWRKDARAAAGEVRGLAFSGDGRLLVSGARVGISGGGDLWLESPRLWDVASGAQVAALDEGQSLVGITADARRVIGAGYTAVRVWDRPSGQEIATLPHWPARTSGPSVTGVGLTPDGSRAISLGSDGTLVVWDVASERELWRVAAHAGDATALALTPDGRQALTGARDGRIRQWDVQNLREVGGASAHTSGIGALAVDLSQPARPRLRSAAQDGQILDWRWEGPLAQNSDAPVTPEPAGNFKPPAVPPGWDPPVRRMAFGGGGDVLLVCDRDRVSATGANSGEKLWEYALPEGRHITSLATASGVDGHVVAVAGGAGAILELDTGRPRLTLPAKLSLSLVVLSADARQFAASDDDGNLWIADAASGATRVRLAGHDGALVDDGGKVGMTKHSPAEAGVFSPDGTLLATAGGDRTVRVWDVGTGSQLGAVPVHRIAGAPPVLGFSPDGRWLVVAPESGPLLFIDARRPDRRATIELGTLPGLEGARPRALAFDPTGARLFVGTGRGTIAILRPL